jgi:UDP-N-acetylmuramate dehydrogenase
MANWRKTIEDFIDRSSSQIFWNEPLAKHTTFGIGGQAECFMIANNKSDLKKIIKIANNEKISLFVIGNGSNLLVSDQGLKGITVKLGDNFRYATAENTQISVGAAMLLPKLVQSALSGSLSGLEFLWGIPGTFGGAVMSNSGAFSQNIGSIVKNINGILSNGKEITLNSTQLKFEYRKACLPDKFIITDGNILLTPNKRPIIKQKLELYKQKRYTTQPQGLSAGSVFKNPISVPAGKIIDDCGLKGLTCKNAVVSKKHGNFIINKSNAHFADVYELIQIIKSTVEIKTGIILEEEIQILPKIQEVPKWQKQRNY